MEETLGALPSVLSAKNAQVSRSDRELLGVVGDAVAMRGVALDQLHESRNDAVGWTLRRDVIRPGILARQHEERLVQLRAQEIDAISTVVCQFALHGCEARSDTTCSRRQ